jgi:DnaK suppressor protein
MSTPVVASPADTAPASPRSLPRQGSQVRRTDAQGAHRREADMGATTPPLESDQPAGAALTALRTSLVELLAIQEENVAALRATVDDLTGETDVDSVLARDVAESFTSRGLDVVSDIQHALGRIDNGTFGSCERCGNPIALERLEVIPYARRCVTCPSPAPRLIG